MKVTIKDLTKKFASRDRTGEMVTAVDTLSAEFESGKLIALLGPSGCGKSTMLNMLSGILPVTSGKIYFDDVDVTDLSPDKREVGLVFQNYALYPHMTVLENICFPLKIKKVPKAERIEKAVEIAKNGSY
ncbi:MAG: ATP-binding cassette domain-containing protein [Erysipelotrichaceae bacterium]|nr:ATP-binding cassette domain-containing protein [Erysipelotrichaceae bacterium]